MSTNKYRFHRFDLKMTTDLAILPSYSRFERKITCDPSENSILSAGKQREMGMSCPKMQVSCQCRAHDVEFLD